MNGQVKSKKRVEEFAEVYTSKREVNAMLDLVKKETSKLDSRFLEPSCGDGNFLIEVLNRKLKVLVKKYKTSQIDFEINAVVVIGSIYGVDIQEDNIMETKTRLFDRFYKVYSRHFKNPSADLIKTLQFILDRNIIFGDTLTFKQLCSDTPLTFCEWVMINNELQRKDFTLADLVAYENYDTRPIFPLQPVKEYPLIDYDKAFQL